MIRHFPFLRLKEEHLHLASTVFESRSASGVLIDLTLARRTARRVPRSGDTELHRAKACSAEEGIGKRSDELNQIGLPAGACFLEQSSEMGLYSLG
jgi:hypothetical protein